MVPEIAVPTQGPNPLFKIHFRPSDDILIEPFVCIIISAAILQIGRCRCYKVWPSVTRWLRQEENEHKGPAVKRKCFSGNRI